ncbi:unnamed protein product [Bursaphelenchus xylophilus]|uniref:(pine wood nematode) hypothetical protein n=1 Tax=Bursaphelenchus xylophilus TaxID=6326 RepID=A0A7I8WGK1_BURXY|nr:unnamed protein product [Bursaphelenchus xylophilus]CAG9111218.1 unnamed protein product [Bursaphelenchus xylophilus]
MVVNCAGCVWSALFLIVIPTFVVSNHAASQTNLTWMEMKNPPKGFFYDEKMELKLKEGVYRHTDRIKRMFKRPTEYSLLDMFCFPHDCWVVFCVRRDDGSALISVHPEVTGFSLATTVLDKNGKFLTETSVTQYVQFLLSVPFVFGSLEHNTTKPVRIYNSGLGFGTMAMALASINPMIHITGVELEPATVYIGKKWLGFEEGRQIQVHYEDSTVFIRNASRNGLKYDFILLDLCYNDISEDYKSLCPVNSYWEEDTVKANYDVLSDDGIIAMNAVTEHGFDDKVFNELKQLYKQYFRWCQIFQISMNHAMVCGKKEEPSTDLLKSRFQSLNGELKKKFDLLRDFEFEEVFRALSDEPGSHRAEEL